MSFENRKKYPIKKIKIKQFQTSKNKHKYKDIFYNVLSWKKSKMVEKENKKNQVVSILKKTNLKNFKNLKSSNTLKIKCLKQIKFTFSFINKKNVVQKTNI